MFGTVKRAPRPQMLVTAEDWDGPRAAGVTEDEAREGNAELTSREVAVEVAQDVLHGGCRPASVAGELGDPGLPHLDERELGGHEEPVERDEEERRAEPPGDAKEIQ